MAGPVASSSVTLGGRTFPVSPTGVRIEDFDTAGGAYRQAYDAVSARIGSRDEARVVQALHAEYRAQAMSPEDAAGDLLARATRGPSHVERIDTGLLAAELVAMRRAAPGQATAVENALLTSLGNAGDQSRLMQDVRAATAHVAAADARLRELSADAPAATAAIGRAALGERSLLMIGAAVETVGGGRMGRPRESVNVHEVAYRIEKLAADAPGLAQALRADITGRLSASDAATLNRVLAGDTGFGEGVGRAFAHPADGVAGLAKGLANGFLAIGDLAARGSAMQHANEVEQGAAMQHLFGQERAAADGFAAGRVLREAAGRTMVPQIPYRTVAQAGGGDIGTVVDVAMAGKGIVTGGAKLAARETAEAAVRQADEVAAPAARALDAFDQVAAVAKIDMPHILDGNLSKKGQAGGFHARPNGVDPTDAHMTEQVGLADPRGVYRGKVEVLNPATGEWVAKKTNGGMSTFFPDDLSPRQIETAIRHAYADALRTGRVETSGIFTGDSGQGFRLTGVARQGEIKTAYPLFQ